MKLRLCQLFPEFLNFVEAVIDNLFKFCDTRLAHGLLEGERLSLSSLGRH